MFMKRGFLALSAILCLVGSFVVINTTLEVTGIGMFPVYSDWTIDRTVYSPRYIYWGKNYCEVFPQNCEAPEEELVTNKPEVFNSQGLSDKECKKILFLGDSYTFAPWTKRGESYAAIFSKLYASEKNQCVVLYRVATGGVGNDQELARFIDVVEPLHPNIVVWQFYENDLFENVVAELFSVKNGTLYRDNAYLNIRFLGGFINQRVPLVRNTAIGKHLMFLGETTDVFHVWPINPYNQEQVIVYNQKKVVKMLDYMDGLGKLYQFTNFTTLAPVECGIVQKHPCQEGSLRLHQVLKDILLTRSNYLSMETLSGDNNILGSQINREEAGDGEDLFNVVDDKNPPGARHLSVKGNKKFGTIFYENYRSKKGL